ncbi:PREDICTED: uncharacterized protein LOC105449803 [Wasmannia auropunctata]|uniref:uncharacterized protein LOC105449803 n=1 Tax=Wasmannia auropunctata TaxID=64793 RepID=UPI0005F00FAF|nr:PREDICTED: uncharacterized protein LOC105449803 [Wasmannia auropunctata]
MNKFIISAPGRLCLLDKDVGTDLRTTLTFIQTPSLSLNNNIELDFPQINLFLKIPFDTFVMFFNDYEKMCQLLKNVLIFTDIYHKSAEPIVFIQAFYYLLLYVIYKEKIYITPFNMHFFTKLMLNNDFVCPESFTVCLAACLFHWSRLQKDDNRTINNTDRHKIYSYAAECDKIFFKSGITAMCVCTYSSFVTYRIDDNKRLVLMIDLPTMTILLVDSIQNVNILMPNLEDLKKFYDIVNSVVDHVKPILMDCYTLREYDIYKDREFVNEIEVNTHDVTLETSIPTDRTGKLYNRLQKMNVFVERALGKRTDIGKLCLLDEDAGTDLRTTLTFIETPIASLNNNIEIDFSQISFSLKMPLETFTTFFNNYEEKIRQLYENVKIFTHIHHKSAAPIAINYSTFGISLAYHIDKNKRLTLMFDFPSMTILLVDSIQMQNVDIQMPNLECLGKKFYDIINSVVDHVKPILMDCYNLREYDVYEDEDEDEDFLNGIKVNPLTHDKTLETSIPTQSSGKLYNHLQKMYALVKANFGKCADDTYLYIWSPLFM